MKNSAELTTVLWVDDSPSSARSEHHRSALRSEEIWITVESSLKDAADRVRSEHIDAILVDLPFSAAPDRTGIDAIRKWRPSVPIVAVSYVPFEGRYRAELPQGARFADLIISPDSSGQIPHLPDVVRFLKQGFRVGNKPADLVQPIRNQIVTVNDSLAEFFRNDPQALWTISPRQFEELIADLLRKSGYEVSLTPTTRDGGRDVVAFKKDAIQNVMLFVECKRYVPPNKVGVRVPRELYGVVERERATGGVVATTSYFTRAPRRRSGIRQCGPISPISSGF